MEFKFNGKRYKTTAKTDRVIGGAIGTLLYSFMLYGWLYKSFF